MSIEIERLLTLEGIPDDAALTRYARTGLAEDLASSAEHEAATQVHLRIVDEAEGRALNHQWRGKDAATNVLSFPSSLPSALPDGTVLPLLGDVVLCAPVIAREAAQQGKELAHHWAHLVIHGVLHLRGYDHTQSTSAEAMEQLERTLLQMLDIPDPYEASG
ncbi:MAG: rRNA maturation RNase YbeY [Pseudomonadota bacterium]